MKNWDQKINLVMIDHASAEDTRLLGGSGDMLPQKMFEILGPQIAGNVWKLSILSSQRYFVSFEIFHDPIRRTFVDTPRTPPPPPAAYVPVLCLFIRDIKLAELPVQHNQFPR